MALPIMLDIDDVERWTFFLRSKPTGTTVKDAEAVLGKPVTDGRKVSALVSWGLIRREEDRLNLTQLGRDYAMGDQARKAEVLRRIIPSIPAYIAIVDWAVHQYIQTITASDVAAHWVEYNRVEVGTDNSNSLNYMALCFFNLLKGARLGTLTLGRRGQATRFETDLDSARSVIDTAIVGAQPPLGVAPVTEEALTRDYVLESTAPSSGEPKAEIKAAVSNVQETSSLVQSVFVGHGKNQRILTQVKELLTYGRFEPVIAEEEQTTAIPVPQKVREAMRRCQAGIITVSADEEVTDDQGGKRFNINDNVLIEIGAAFVLYDTKVILLVDERVVLPSNLQGIYTCRYTGESLDFDATMKLLQTLNRIRE